MKDGMYKLNRKDLLNLLESVSPDHNTYSHPLIQSNGIDVANKLGSDWRWRVRDDTTDEQIYQIYKLCTE